MPVLSLPVGTLGYSKSETSGRGWGLATFFLKRLLDVGEKLSGKREIKQKSPAKGTGSAATPARYTVPFSLTAISPEVR